MSEKGTNKTLFIIGVLILIIVSSGCVSEELQPEAQTPEQPGVLEEEPVTPEEELKPQPTTDQTMMRDFRLPLPLFASDSAWNQRADSAAVLPESDAQILTLYRVLLGDISSLKGYDEPATNWPYMDINIYDFTVPIFRAGDGVQEVWICDDEGVVGWAHPKFGIESEGGPVTVPAPTGTVRPAGPENDGADGWLVLYHPETFTSYDYFGATPYRDEKCLGFQGGLTGEQILQAGVVDFFDVRGPGANADGLYSARAVGTPLLGGLIIPEDIESGVIAHALAFAIPGPRNTARDPYEPDSSDYFYPASTTETDFYNTETDALASGQRIRLKQTIVDEEGQVIDESELAPIAHIFLTALRDYGAYVVDNAGGFTFYAEDVHTAVLNLSDDEVNALIGEAPGTPLPEGMTKWQIVFERLSVDLELIPLAISPGDEEADPKTAEIEIANFEVVEPAYNSYKEGTYLKSVTTASASDIGLSATTDTDGEVKIWSPAPGTSWQWHLTDQAIDQSFDVGMYDIELFDSDASIVTALHSQGRKVICYVSVGLWEDWRPDKDQFPDSVIGNDYEGWPGEKWLDIRQIDILAPIMRARFDMCKEKGFDGIEPDNIDGYDLDTGFPLTYQDQLDYNIWLANEAHSRGLSIGLKNDEGQVADLIPYFDWAMTEDCFYQGWCDQVLPFIQAGKAVFVAEYTDTGITLDDFCTEANLKDFDAILKNRDLDAYREACR